METVNNPKVLIIEDEADLRQVIKEFFEMHNWDVGTAENGRQGADALRATDYDLVLSDIRMPLVTGLEMLKNLPSEVKQKTSIIMMSGYAGHAERTVQELGAAKLLAKPVSACTLLREIGLYRWQKKRAP